MKGGDILNRKNVNMFFFQNSEKEREIGEVRADGEYKEQRQEVIFTRV